MSNENGPLEHMPQDGHPAVELEGKPLEAPSVPPPTTEELSERVNKVGDDLRAVIVDTKRLPRVKGIDPHQDQGRALALAQAHLQTGFMWLRRAVKPQQEF